jgi:hypothetical protein
MDAGSKTDSSTSAKTPHEIEREKKRRPLREMIANGKDAREATLMWVVNEILDSINWNEIERAAFAVEKDELVKRRSILGQVREVCATVIDARKPKYTGPISPKAWFYDPVFAESWSGRDAKQGELEDLTESLESILGRYPKLKNARFKKELSEKTKRLAKIVPAALSNEQMLYATIGFMLGARVYKRELANRLDTLTQDIIGKFTIENPLMISDDDSDYFDVNDDHQLAWLLRTLAGEK